jgi:hypothetical protein
METHEQSPYYPLESTDNFRISFRLLSLAPGHHDDPINITLTNHSILGTEHGGKVIKEELLNFCKKVLKTLEEQRALRNLSLVEQFVSCMVTIEFDQHIDSMLRGGRNVQHIAAELILKFEPSLNNIYDALSALSEFLSYHEAPIPDYDALSYTWGTLLSPTHATVNNVPRRITENLDVALRHLRCDTTSKVLWIDALCINQEDVEERNHQVQHMHKIYGAAQQTIVWLGPAADQSDVVMDCFESGTIPDVDAYLFAYYVYKLMTRPWWTRVWIIQEIVFAHTSSVHCGHRSVELGAFADAIEHFKSHFPTRDNDNSYNSPERIQQTKEAFAGVDPEDFPLSPVIGASPNHDLDSLPELKETCSRVIRKYLQQISIHWLTLANITLQRLVATRLRHMNNEMPLASMLEVTADFESTDPRDQIYALLNMCSQHRISLVPNYKKPVTSVFSEAMAVMVTENLPLAWRTRALHLERSNLPSLPSWVPNMTHNPFVSTNIAKRGRFGTEHLVFASEPKQYHPSAEIVSRALKQLTHSKSSLTFLLPARYASTHHDFKELHTMGSSMGTIIRMLLIPVDIIIAPEIFHQAILVLRDFLGAQAITASKAMAALLSPPGTLFDPDLDHIKAFNFLLATASFEGLFAAESTSGAPGDIDYAVLRSYIIHYFAPEYDRTRHTQVVSLPSSSFNTRLIPGESIFGHIDVWYETLVKVAGQTLFCTDTGHVGRSTGGLREGDVLTGLFGIDLPFILRKADNGKYTMVNVAHVAHHLLSPPWRNRDQRFRKRKKLMVRQEEKFVII